MNILLFFSGDDMLANTVCLQREILLSYALQNEVKLGYFEQIRLHPICGNFPAYSLHNITNLWTK